MRVGLFGTGPWAELTQGPALAAHPGVELTGVWGRRTEAASALAERLGTRPYADAGALLDDCEAVAVALPPDVQAPLAVRAADAGRHLLLDKPVATTERAAREVAEAAERAGVASVVFFTLHFSEPTADWIREQRRAAEEHGDWLTGGADWFSPVFGGSDSPFAASPWRRAKGALWDVGPHALSVLLPLLGDVVTERIGVGRGPGDTVHLTFRHTGGASSTVGLSHSVPPAAAEVSARVRGPAGIATLPERATSAADAFGVAVDTLLTAARATGSGTATAPAASAAPGTSGATAGERADGEVEYAATRFCDARFGLRVTEILAAAEAALATAEDGTREMAGGS
ncbi:Gfo/Idh/MocA family oxidoreductase [Streptomyces sp. AJS327]|uniref:Gfo/Idh/MocA family protein n=1 Tax=Streptomyces sp. AJS327 TaxID=2545265 RepID=UPI0015DF62BB|nr:Gfo/Idh/MocA family oxidoreductase [Streptomyces sp. AJS327]MBA0050120.1 Gfo/Idh/MocA family oxidoreductase [Streptomyces sp. AJS327]